MLKTGFLLFLSLVVLLGCNPDTSGPSDPDITRNKIPVILPDTIDVDVYRIEITSDSADPVVYYEKPGKNGLYISVPSGLQTQLIIDGYKNELLVFSATATIHAGQKDAVSLNPDDPTPVFSPANISAVLTDKNTVQLTWTRCTGASAYLIYKTTDTLTEPQKIQTMADTTFTDNASGNTQLFYQVRAQFSNGISSPTRFVSVVPETPITPDPPSDVKTGISGDSTIYLNWQSLTGATGYNIYRSETENGEYALVGSVTDTFFTTTLNTGKMYYFKVSVKIKEKESDPSDIVSIIIKESVPSTPSGLIAISPSATTISLQFNASTNATSYIIYRGLSETSLSSIDTISSTSFDDKNLLQNTTYYYAVAAISGTEKSAVSSVAAIKTGALVPSTPTGLVATAQSATAILLKFNSVLNAESYAIFTGTSENSLVIIDTITETSFTSSSLQSGTTYYFAVTAINKEGISSRSQTVSAETQQSAPVTPTGLTVSAVTASSIQIQFNTVSGAAGYIIYRGTSSGSLLPVDTITANSLTDLNLQPATTYYYAVAAYNAGGVSQPSATSSATTQDSPPATPSGLKVSAVTANSITLQFSSVTGATGYKIYSSTNNSTFTLLASITTTTYTNTDLAASTTRYYKVSSVKGSIESAQSASVSGTTQATAAKIAVVTASMCTGCGDCRGACTFGALTIVNRKAVIDPSKCNGCGKCTSRCRRGAIKLQ
ncbi:MAG TPA: fibronectin type III domain-containing protein [Chitinispirillaceae bacterium]|nr:fibronectin type III domain-containing protein [Chitinispirillaceae bacterium]